MTNCSKMQQKIYICHNNVKINEDNLQFHHISSTEEVLYLHCEPLLAPLTASHQCPIREQMNWFFLMNQSKRFATLVSYLFESDSLRQ